MSKKLLLADDSITIQKVIQITFAHEDYELTITDNGDAALAQAQALKPDLVMADVYMPGKNGYELCTAVKQDPALQHVPVLLLAGSFEPFDEDKARAAKADAWIEKPFESQTLVDKVAELLSAAPVAAEATAPAVAEPVAAPVAAPVPVVEEVFIEEPSVVEAPLAAAPAEDAFADISFDESPAEAVAEPVAAVSEPEPSIDDFGFEAEVPAIEEPVAAPAGDDFSFSEEPASAVEDDSFVFDAEPMDEVAAPAEDDFTFVEEPVAEVPAVAEPDLSAFDETEEVMALDEDDILGAEELEPITDEPTLAAWSRDDALAEEPVIETFAEPEILEVAEVPVEPAAFEPAAEVAVEPSFEAEIEEVAEVSVEPAAFEPAAEVAVEPSFEAEIEEVAEVSVEPAAFEPAAEVAIEPVAAEAAEVMEIIPEVTAPVEEPVAAPVVAAAPVDVEAKAGALSEAEIEQIVEKVVGQVVEKLAGTILEKVAWEVVPDMAENIIKAEIQKIKESAA